MPKYCSLKKYMTVEHPSSQIFMNNHLEYAILFTIFCNILQTEPR